MIEEREVVPYNKEVSPKLPKTVKGKKRASLAESKKDWHVAKVCPSNLTWNPKLELDGVAIPWNSTIKESREGMPTTMPTL